MLYPDIDSVIVEVGPFALRWYGFAYLAGFMCAWWLAKLRPVVYQLKNSFRDGTTHILFSPEDFIARPCRPARRARSAPAGKSHGDAESRYHGVFAPSSPMRRAIVPAPARVRRRNLKDSAHAQATRQQNTAEPPADTTDAPTAPLTWAQRLKRVFEIDISLCPLCGGQLRVIASRFLRAVTDPDLIRKILDHVNSRAPPRLPPRRAETHPNLPELFAER